MAWELNNGSFPTKVFDANRIESLFVETAVGRDGVVERNVLNFVLFAADFRERVFRSDQRRTPDISVRHTKPAAGLVQRTGLGRAAETVVHGPGSAAAAHVPRAGARPRARHPGLRPGRDRGRRVRRAGARRQPEHHEQQNRFGAEPDGHRGQPGQARPVQRQPRVGEPAEGRVLGDRRRNVQRAGQPLPVRLSPVPVPAQPSVRQPHVRQRVHREELLHITVGAERTARRLGQTEFRRQVPADLVRSSGGADVAATGRTYVPDNFIDLVFSGSPKRTPL